MSRIGKKPILIPEGVAVETKGSLVLVKGPKGQLSREFRPEIKIEIKNNQIFVRPAEEKTVKKGPAGREDKRVKAFWGLTRMLIANMVEGVVSGFEKKLEIEGVGFRAEVSSDRLILLVGFSHPVELKIPDDLKVIVEKNIVTVSGIDKETVGQFASIIRKVKPAEPYKGKGIKYLGEKIRRKLGKKAVSTTA